MRILQKPARIPFTAVGYQKILDEKKKLLGERPEAVENLRKSREMGDLSENGYYKASRARLSSLDARLRQVERLIRYGSIVASANTGTVDIGCIVTITDGTIEQTYNIVGGYESDPSNKTISHLSPLGKALLGKKKGDMVHFSAPAGDKEYTILTISSS